MKTKYGDNNGVGNINQISFRGSKLLPLKAGYAYVAEKLKH